MISDPFKYAKMFSPYVDRMSFHVELFEEKPQELKECIKHMKNENIEIGLAVNPETSIELLTPFFEEVDYFIIMTVKAGFPGQNFIPNSLHKVKFLHENGFSKDIIVDGGINKETAALAISAGANILVSGSYIFSSEDRENTILSLKEKNIG